MPVVGIAEVLVVPSFKGTQSKIGKEFAGMEDSAPVKKAGLGVGKALKVAAGAGLAGGAAFLGTALTKGFGRLKSIEQAKATLVGLGNSAQDVELIMQNANAAVKGTAYGLGDAATVAAQMVAAGIKPGEDLQKTLTLVGDAATIAGTDIGQMGAVFQKAAASNKVQGDVIAQLHDAGIPALQLIATEMGVTTEEASKMASSGAVDFATFQRAMEKGMGGAAQESGKTLKGAFDNSMAAIGRFGANLIEQVYPQVTEFFNGFMEWMGPVEQMGKVIGEKLGDALKNFSGWVKDNKDMILSFLPVVGTAVAGLGAYFAITKTIAGFKAIQAWYAATTFAQKGLNAAMKANPIGLIVTAITVLVAALVWLYNNNETARNIMQAAWRGIKKAVEVAWSGIKVAFQAIKDFISNVLVPVFKWLYENVVKPVWNGIKLAITIAVAAVMVAVKALVWFWQNVLGPVIKFVWEKIIKPVFSALGKFVQWVWNTLLKPTFNLFKSGFQAVGTAIKWVWNNVLKPVFDALGKFFKWVWDNWLKPAFEALKRDFKVVAQIIKQVWNNNIKPVFDALGKFVRDTVVPVFKKGVDKIKSVWESIKDVAKKPIKFVIDTVINKGLIGAFNKVAGWIPGVKKLDKVSIPGFARGGWTGPGAKYDEAGIVHADEFVIRKESQRSLAKRAPGFLDSLNRYGAAALGYASGGLVRPVKGGRVTSGFGAGRGRYPHAGIDLAVPVGTPVFASMAGRVSRAGWNAITGRSGIGAFLDHEGGRNTYYGHLSRLMVKVGDMVRKGQQIALSGNTGKSTGPHLHWETWTGGKPVNPAAYLGGAMLPEGGVGGDPGSGFNPLSFITDAMGKIGGWFKDKFPGGGMLADIAQGTGTKLFTDVVEWVRSKIDFLGDVAKDTWSNVKGFFTGGKSKHKEAVRGVAERYGWGSGDQWSALQSIVSKESGWNPNAANPRSSARGLFQKMTSLHGPVEGSAAGQAEWGLRYIKQRYGNPMNAWSHWQRHNSYAGGGHVQPSLYDNGGVLPPGLTSILNNTRKPEAILNPAQWQSVMKSIEVSRRVADNGALVGMSREMVLKVGDREFTAYLDERVNNGMVSVARAASNRRR